MGSKNCILDNRYVCLPVAQPPFGRIFHFGRLPVNTRLSGYYHAVKPDYGPNWQIRTRV
jgi:hypothetical protein